MIKQSIKTLLYPFQALKRYLFSVPVPADLNVIVVSPGGVGTSFFLEHVARFKQTNCLKDHDGLKHAPFPRLPGRPNAFQRFVYITGPESLVFASIDRRGFVRQQGAKLGSVGAAVLSGPAQQRAFETSVRRQKKAWTRPSDERFLIMNYDELWDRVEDVAGFLDITDPEFVAEFPKQKERASK